VIDHVFLTADRERDRFFERRPPHEKRYAVKGAEPDL
jgi:hypothetical protein